MSSGSGDARAASSPATVRVLGVDGWKGRWVGVELLGGRFAGARAFDALEAVLERAEVDGFGVDVPIGLPVGESIRPADAAARRVLGRRGASVFAVPPLEVLEASDYREALARARRVWGRGLSRQAHALAANVLEAERLLRSGRLDRVVETHPEVSFAAMHGGPLPWSKKTWNGLALRRRLLAAEGIEVGGDLGGAGAAAPDDVLDAAAAAWSAHRWATGAARTLPEDPPEDPAGRPTAIWV